MTHIGAGTAVALSVALLRLSKQLGATYCDAHAARGYLLGRVYSRAHALHDWGADAWDVRQLIAAGTGVEP